MKTKISRIGKRSLSILLTMMIVMSMMVVGMVTTNAASAFPNSMKLFVDVGSSGFNNDNATIDAYFFGTSGNTWVKMDSSGTTFTCLTPSTGTYENVIFSRSSNHACDFNNDWNQTNDIAYSATNNKYTFSDFYGNGSWSLATMSWYLSGTLDGYDTGNTSTDYVMSHTSNGVYTFTKTFTNSTSGYQYVTVNDGYNSYHPETTNASSGTVGSKLDTDGGNDPKWRVSAGNGDTVTFTWDSFTRTLSWTVTSNSWYLSGWINNEGVINGSSSWKMTKSSTNVYTFTTTFTADNSGYQYVTVNDGSTSYHAATTNAGSGTAASSTTQSDGTQSPKWRVTAAAGDTATFTWNSSTKVLSWTVTSQEWYLSGTLQYPNDHNPVYENLDTVAKSFKMTADGTNTYSFTYTYPSDVVMFYVVVNDGTTAYHPADTNRGNEAPYVTTDPNLSGSPSWHPEFTAGDTVKFRWNTSTGKLSWEEIVDDTTYTVSEDSSLQTGASLTFSETAGGELKTSFKKNDTVYVTVTNPDGYECSGVTVSPSSTVTKNSDGTYSFTMPSSNVTVSATFTKIVESGDYTITKTASAYGTMSVTTSSDVKEGTANANDTITVTVNPLKGYACTGLTVATSDATVETTKNDDGTYTFTMPSSDVTLTATFETTIITYNLTGSVSNATVTFSTPSSSSVKVAQPGEKITVTITPNSGYICSALAVLDSNGVEMSIEKLSSTKYTFIMPECDIKVSATVTVYTPETNHTFTVYFKAPSAFAYQPKVSLDGAESVSMTKGQELGKVYSGALTIYWFSCEFTVDTSTTHTLTFKTARTNLNATITDYFINDTYYLAVDNLMTGTEVVDLSQYSDSLEYVRNYYRSATHMVYPYTGASDDTDNTLGFTNIDGVRCKMGECIRDGRVSITSATLIQKVSAEAETVDNVQMALLDVNLDGTVDVRDATLTQKYLVSI